MDGTNPLSWPQTLSYKSIREAALAAVDREALRLLEPVFDSDPVRRVMMLHPELQDLLENDAFDRRIFRLRADLEAFVMGQDLAVSITPYEHKDAYLGLLDPTNEGIWEIRSRDPDPGMRVFGRFAYTDAFVALGWSLRSKPDDRWPAKKPLGSANSLEYQFAQIETLERWESIFPKFNALTGDDVSELLSEKYNIV